MAFAMATAMAASLAIGVAGQSAGGQAAPAEPTREVRADVPLGKNDAEFGRQVKTPGKLTPPSTPLQVRLQLSETPELGEPFTVELQVYAAEAAPGTQAQISLPVGAEVVSGARQATLDLAQGQTSSVTVTARITDTGAQRIEGKALRTLGSGDSWGDLDQVFFRVGEQKSLRGLDSTPDRGMVAYQVPGSAQPTASAKRAVGTFKICWQFVNRQNGKTALRDALVYLMDDDGASGDDVLRTGFTNAAGCVTWTGVNTTDADKGGAVDTYVQFQTQRSGRYRVETYGNGIYYCNSGVTNNTGGGRDFGTWWCGGTSGAGRSLPIFDDMYLMRRFIMETAVNRGFGTTPGSCTVKWQTGGTDGTYYTTSDNKVHLTDSNWRSRDTVVHECSHRQMHVLYGAFPRTDCPSPHYIQGVSGKICAWTEGWTYVNTAGVDGNPFYTFDSGAQINFETQNCNTAGWQDGPKVEGRVGGVLIDLMDPFTRTYGPVTGFSNEASPCGGSDQVSGQYGRIWDLFSDQNDIVFIAQEGVTDSYSRAWRNRGAVGYPQTQAWNTGKVSSIFNFTRD